MTNAPERIWHTIDRRGKIADCPDAHVEPCASVAKHYQQYVRKDASDQAIADAYARGVADAAQVCTYIIKNYDVMTPDGKKYEPMHVQRKAKGMVRLAREDIEALTNPVQAKSDLGQENDNEAP